MTKMMALYKFLVCFILLCLLLQCTIGQDSSSFPGQLDLVTSLPGMTFKLNPRIYSGYLESHNGTTQLHYMFFESQSIEPQQDPVVLWLNGGPGCSSLLGALTEISPLRMHPNGTLTPNAFAWNQKANLLFLESPAGVGFSYKLEGNYSTNDRETAQVNLEALQSFYIKFPHLTSNPFYITGESYAGVYIPTLSVLALEHKFPPNFKGVAIGNGFLDFESIANSVFYFLYYHGIVDSTSWNYLIANCCANMSRVDRCDFIAAQNSSKCSSIYERLIVDFLKGKLNINPYNIYKSCAYEQSPKGSINTEQFEAISLDYVTRKLVLQTFGSEESYYDGSSSNPSIKGYNPPCLNYDYLSKWLNSHEVQVALHVNSSLKALEQVLPWAACKYLGYVEETKSVAKYIRKMVDSGQLKVLIYNGDVDAACNFVGDKWFVDGLGYNVSIAHRPFMYEGQVAGFSTFYDKQLTFTTIHGAGHMVPEDKPGPALQMFNQFLQ